MGALLTVKKLAVEFRLETGVARAVEDVSFEVNEHETVVLAGESGSGKSVSCLALTRLVPKTAFIGGNALFDGRDLLALPERELSGIRGNMISYVFQEPASCLNPVFTVGYQIREALMLSGGMGRKEAHERSRLLLEQVRIGDPDRVLNSYPHQLSGGMNQRAFIAMSLACKPRLLIADEPTTSLDVTIEAEILTLLCRLQKELGFAMLFITHNLAIARSIADNVYVLHRGRTVEHGTPSEIFLSPRHSHTKELIAAYEKIGHL